MTSFAAGPGPAPVDLVAGSGVSLTPNPITGQGTISSTSGGSGAWNAGTVNALGAGLSNPADTLTAQWSAGAVSAINGGSVVSGTLAITTQPQEWNAGTVNAVGAGLSDTSDTLSAQWSAGSITALNGGLVITSGTLNAEWTAGSASAIGAGLTLSGGTLAATGVTAAGQGAALASGTLSVANAITLAGTAAGTLSVAPASGTTAVVITCPTAGGTITLTGTPAFQHQTMRLVINQGSTASSVVLGTGFAFTPANPSYTATAVALETDVIQCIANLGTAAYDVMAISQGLTA